MPLLPRMAAKTKEIDKQGYLSCLRSSNTLRTNQVPGTANSKGANGKPPISQPGESRA